MPNPTKQELWAQLANFIKIYDSLYQFSASNSPNYIDLEDTAIQSLEGNHTRDSMEVLDITRKRLNNAYLDASSLLFYIIRELAIVGYGSNGDSIDSYLADIYEGLSSDTETVKNRDFTFGSVSASVSNYDGTAYRTEIDKDNHQIESGQPGVVKIECIADKNSIDIVSGREKMKIFGSGVRKKNELDIGTCTDEIQVFQALRAEDGLLIDPSFDAIEDSVTKNQQTGWYLSDTAAFNKNTSDVYRLTPDEETGSSLEFTDNASVTQYSQRESLGVDVDPAKPIFLIAYYMRKTSADGSLTMRLGQSTVQVADLTAKTNDTWYPIVIGPGSDDGYTENWNEDYLDTSITPNQRRGARVQFTIASNTTGSVIIDNVILAQPIKFNGCYYLVPAGSLAGDILKGDYWTFADTSNDTGRIQYTIARLYNWHFPHTSGSPTYADA